MVYIFVLMITMILLSQQEEKTFGSLHLSRLSCILVQEWHLEHTGCPCLCIEESTPLGIFLRVLMSQQPLGWISEILGEIEKLWHKGRGCSRNSFVLKCINLFQYSSVLAWWIKVCLPHRPYSNRKGDDLNRTKVWYLTWSYTLTSQPCCKKGNKPQGSWWAG